MRSAMSSDEQRRKQRDDQEHQQHQQHQQQHPEHKDGQTLDAAAQRSSSSASSTPLSPGTTTRVDGSSRPQEAYARRDAEVGGRPTMPPSKPDTIPLATLSALLPLSGEEGVDCDGDSRSPLSSHGSAGLKPVPTLAHRQHASKGQRDDRSRGATNIRQDLPRKVLIERSFLRSSRKKKEKKKRFGSSVGHARREMLCSAPPMLGRVLSVFGSKDCATAVK